MSTQSDSPFLWRTPPYCNTVECYVHGPHDAEHHVEGCPMYDTVASAMHRVGHAADEVALALKAGAASMRDSGETMWQLSLVLAGSRRKRLVLRVRRYASRYRAS